MAVSSRCFRRFPHVLLTLLPCGGALCYVSPGLSFGTFYALAGVLLSLAWTFYAGLQEDVEATSLWSPRYKQCKATRKTANTHHLA